MADQAGSKSRNRRPPRTVGVLHKELLTPHMLRVTLGGDELAGFPADAGGAYIKLRLLEPEDDDGKPLLRTYTVRRFDAATRTMEVDFVVHESDGPAMRWAETCRPGDTLRISGPGPNKLVDFSADWFLLAGDMSALPAIGANIERMGDDACGHALVEIISAGDRQDLPVPAGLAVQWIVNPDPETANTCLLDAVRRIEWLPGRVSAWVAGEFSQSLAIRAWLKGERGLTRDDMYASSYWQIGQTEDGHRVSKRNAAED